MGHLGHQFPTHRNRANTPNCSHAEVLTAVLLSMCSCSAPASRGRCKDGEEPPALEPPQIALSCVSDRRCSGDNCSRLDWPTCIRVSPCTRWETANATGAGLLEETGEEELKAKTQPSRVDLVQAQNSYLEKGEGNHSRIFQRVISEHFRFRGHSSIYIYVVRRSKSAKVLRL